MSHDLAEAVASEARVPSSPGAAAQYRALCEAIGMPSDELRQFCSRIQLIGSSGTLEAAERTNAAIIADWSASSDVIARARPGDLRYLVRKKAGSAGQEDKIVSRVDVLAALGLAEEADLLPTPQAFPEIGAVIERAQLTGFIQNLSSSGLWLIHAAGGIEKTAFAQSLTNCLLTSDEVVLFDWFGGA